MDIALEKPILGDTDVIDFGSFKGKFIDRKSNFKQIWNSRKKGDYGIEFFSFVGSDASGFLPLGDIAYAPISPFPPANREPLAFVVGLSDSTPDAFAHPTGFNFILNDHGSGNPDDISYWAMVPPNGYTAVGICVTPHDAPRVIDYWCVKNSLVMPLSPSLLWSDKNQGWAANGDLNMAGMNQRQQVAIPAPQNPTTLLIPPTMASVQNNGQVYGLLLNNMPASTAACGNLFYAVGVPGPTV